MRRIQNASADCLVSFVQEAIEPGSTVHTDGWLGYLPVEAAGYDHKFIFLHGERANLRRHSCHGCIG